MPPTAASIRTGFDFHSTAEQVVEGIDLSSKRAIVTGASSGIGFETAKALAQLAGEAGVPLPEPKDFSETAGRGVKAEVGGARVLVGRAQWLKDNGVKEDVTKSVDLNETEGWSLIFVARDGQCIGWVGLQDQTRPEAREALASLRTRGSHLLRTSGASGLSAAPGAAQPSRSSVPPSERARPPA